jgi:hypothetical protein
VQASLAPPTLADWRDIDALVFSVEDDCRRLHARYMRVRDALLELAERRSARTHTPPARTAARRAG